VLSGTLIALGCFYYGISGNSSFL